MSEVFNVGDPDASVTYPVIDNTGGTVDWPDPEVKAGAYIIAAEWLGPADDDRDLKVPLDALPIGSYYLWLTVPGNNDIMLGEVSIIEPNAAPVNQPTACLWPVDPACLGDSWENFTESVRLRARRLASQTLTMLTANRVGVCPITVRPQGRRGACFIPTYGGPPWQLGMNMAGQWVNNCGFSSSPCEVPLPHPVGRIDEVRVDGAVIDPADYRIDNGHFLVWQGTGDCPWPLEQDMNLPDTEVGTFSITMLNAYPVTAAGAHAAGLLAVEYAKACSGGGKCRLPSNVVSVVRQGVAMEIRPGSFPDGFTGIREVDAFISAWNPRAQRQQSTVWSPDQPTYRYTTLGG